MGDMAKVVLVAEDDTAVLGLIRAVLEDEGFTVAATLGAETLVEARERYPDMVLLDYQMPEMDGIQVAQELRADPETQAIPIVAMTAARPAPRICREMDANGCLGKPFNLGHLISVVTCPTHTTH